MYGVLSMLTVRELIDILESADPHAVVVLSSDSEGNNFSPVIERYSAGVYIPDSSWSGEFYSTSDSEGSTDMSDPYYSDELEEFEQLGMKAIVLYPVN